MTKPPPPTFDPVPHRESAPDRTLYTRLPDEIRHPKLVRLYHHWHEVKGARLMPSRADVDPVALPYLLGNLLLVDVMHDPRRYRYRLVGTKLTERIGRDMTGKSFEDVPEPVYRARLYDWHGRVVDGRAPQAATTARRLLERWSPYELLTLPLSTDGINVDMTLTGLYYLET